MVWTDTTRIRYDRIGGRYSSDCNDEEWALIESFMPCRRPTGVHEQPTCAMSGMLSNTWLLPAASGR